MAFRLIPNHASTFQRIEAAVDNAHAAALTFHKLTNDYGALAERRAELKEIEHRGDLLTREIHANVLRSSRARPDRETVRVLAETVDDIIDALYAAGNRLYLYDIPKAPEPLKPFSKLIVDQTKALVAAVGELKSPKTWGATLRHCEEIHRLENEADKVLNDTLARLFRQKDAILVMKFKEIYEFVEAASDHCDDAADAIHDLVRSRRSGVKAP